VEGARRLGEVARTFYRGDDPVDVRSEARFAMNSVAQSCELAMRGVGLDVLGNVLALRPRRQRLPSS